MELSIIALFAGGSFAVAITMAIFTWKQSVTHRKYVSAQILLEMIKTSKEFRKTIDDVLDHDVGEYTEDDDLERLLNHFEDFGALCKDNLITIDHIRTAYGAFLRKIKKDDLLERLYGNRIANNPRLFERLRELCDKID